MKAMILESLVDLTKESEPLKPSVVPEPVPGPREVLLKVLACGVCHTELDEIEGRTPPPSLPVIPGHQVVGVVARCGKDVSEFKTGDRLGVAWIFSSWAEVRMAFSIGVISLSIC